MTLVECYECGKRISDKALTCPKCGYPVGEIGDEQEFTQEKDLDSFDFYYNRGIKRMESGDNKGALSDYTKVISIAPYHPSIYEVYLNLGAVQARLGDPTKALISTNKALEINPRYQEALNNKELLMNGIKREQLWEGIGKVLMVPIGIILFAVARVGIKVLFRNLFS